DPWGGRDRVNVLLLGGDGGVGRTGVRTDSVILVSIDTTSGKTTMFSLPRNMMYAQFPEDSPLHDLYPDGYTGEGDAGFYMLNAIYGQIPARHPGILGASKNEGADAIKQAVSGSLGVPVDYYVLVNLKGFQEIVDAIGGITVNVNEPVAINGNTDAGIPPTGYIQPGPDQHLDGFHALWFARGRYGSDDYERMDRQRCTVDAIIEAADPFTLLTRYQQLVAAGKEIIFSDIPLKLVPAFVDLALEVKDAKVRSVVFKTSERFFSGDPDYAWVQETVAKALTPRPRSGPKDDPGRPKNAKSSCAYDPVTPTS
ncbi:MAG: LytR family transcriptional regulator, partial [Actinobacteria bacterium]|nr:LytR family transcriptional regulator [Actinomycetota bacterium]